MVETEIEKLKMQIEANRREYSGRIDRVCENQRRFETKVDELLGLFRGVKKAIWGAGALAGTIGGGFFAYFPQFVDFLYRVIHAG